MNTSLENVRAKVIEMVPDWRLGKCPNGDRITLADVLRAIEAFVEPDTAWEYAINANGDFIREWGEGRHEITSYRWNLALPLDDQEPEVIEFLAKVLGV